MKDRWIQALRQDPHGAVSDLFNGRAGVAFETRLDVPELLCRWFPKSLEDDRDRLDDALLWWLGEMQGSYTSELDRIGFAVYSKRVCDALIALQLLDLPRSRSAIRSDLAAWLRWLSPLRLASGRDPALECYSLLTQGQPDTGHMAMWLRLAADRRPEYLTVALAGLRRLPNDGDARQNQMLMLQAVFRHAVVRFHDLNGAFRFFNRRFAAVRGLFPRAPEHWKGVLDDALHGLEHIDDPLAVDLAARLRENPPIKGSRPPMRRSRRRRAVSYEVWRPLEDDIVTSKQPADALAQRLFRILEQNHEYALAAGDSYPFVRALGNLGNKLLEYHRLGTAHLLRFGVLIERALFWEPGNPYCWTLWAKWFEAQDRQEAQEAILRETLRLFPRNAVAQVELARVLMARGETWWNEAEHYVCRTLKEDSNNAHAHVVRARQLAMRGRRDEGGKTLSEFLERNPDNAVVREALKQLRAGVFATGPAATGSRSKDNLGAEVPGSVSASLHQELLRRGALASEFTQARIAGVVSGRTRLIEQECHRGDALAGFYSQWLELPDTPDCPPHAWAWNACLHWQRPFVADEWDQLAERFPEAASETRLLQTLAAPDTLAATTPRYGESNGALSRPLDAIVRDGRALLASTNLDESDRDDFACSLMACAAVSPPEFALGATPTS